MRFSTGLGRVARVVAMGTGSDRAFSMLRTRRSKQSPKSCAEPHLLFSEDPTCKPSSLDEGASLQCNGRFAARSNGRQASLDSEIRPCTRHAARKTEIERHAEASGAHDVHMSAEFISRYCETCAGSLAGGGAPVWARSLAAPPRTRACAKVKINRGPERVTSKIQSSEKKKAEFCRCSLISRESHKGGGPAQRKGVVEGLASGLMTPRLSLSGSPYRMNKKADKTALARPTTEALSCKRIASKFG